MQGAGPLGMALLLTTVADTLAASYVANTSKCAAAAAEAAASHKETKYAAISQMHLFFPPAFETFGPINQIGHDFISTLGHHITSVTDDPPWNLIFVPASFNSIAAFQRHLTIQLLLL